MSAGPGTPVPGALVDLAAAVELLERALVPLTAVLARVVEEDLPRPTPCVGWPVAALLDHLEDGIDAFTEAAAGSVGAPTRRAADRLLDGVAGDLTLRSRRLLEAWVARLDAPAAPPVALADLHLAAPLLVSTAALELAVHGQDLASVVGGPRLAPALAADLLPVAGLLVAAGDARDAGGDPAAASHTGRFAAPLAVRPDAAASTRLLARLGRHERPPARTGPDG